MNFALALAQNKQPGVRVDVSKFGADPADVARQVLFTDAKPETLAAIEKQAKGSANVPVAGLLLGSPDFQRR